MTTNMNAAQIVERIAPNEKAMLDSLFNPVEFSDGAKGTYSGYIVKCNKTHVRFAWMGHKELLVNASSVLGQWSKLGGKTYYHYVLNPFGENVPYSVEQEAAKMLRDKFL